MHETSVVLGMGDSALQEEVLDFLDRLPRVRVIGTAAEGAALARAIKDSRPDAAVVSPEILGDAPQLDGATVLVVAPAESTAALRMALQAGARGFYLWPDEREALAGEAERARGPAAAEPAGPGRVVAVYGSRGGAGATFLATNLAAACAARHAGTVLVDLDIFHADLTGALGVPSDPSPPTIADLAPVLDELAPEHLDRVLHDHLRGFRVLLAPPDPASLTDGAGMSSAIRMLRSRFEMVVVHVPRTIDEAARAGLEEADDILLVVTLDVSGLRGARRALAYLNALGVRGTCHLVLNRVGRGEVVPGDAERVLEMRPVSIFPVDRRVGRAQNRGELVAGGSGPAARRMSTLARTLLAWEER